MSNTSETVPNGELEGLLHDLFLPSTTRNRGFTNIKGRNTSFIHNCTHKVKEPDNAWGPKKPTVVLEIILSESYASLYRDVELVRVGHLAALRIIIESRLAVQDAQTPNLNTPSAQGEGVL
ncbi:hypothetical protein N7527_009938 [Penicillium freii]|nr:hypothetical protein N7527_009938 [Penicillium freii]